MADLAADAWATLTSACHRSGLDPDGAELLRLRSNAVFKLRAPIVVRITSSASAQTRMPLVLEVTRWLHAQGFPTVRPADDIQQPLLLDATTVTFWEYLPASSSAPTTRELGQLLGRLHAFPEPPVRLHRFDDPLKSIRYDVQHRPGILQPTEQAWLLDRIADLTRAWHTLPVTTTAHLLHGDAWIDNLLRHRDGHPVLCDWDAVALGDRPWWDLIHTYHGQRRFGLTAADVDDFTAAYGHDLRQWPHYETLMAIRDLYAIGIHIRNAPGDPFSRHELRHRLDSIKDDDLTRPWNLRAEHISDDHR
jgi:hypothetical protein